MWAYIIPALALIAVAVIEAIAARERKDEKASRAKVEARAERRAKESLLSMKMMASTCKLGVVTAKAVTHQHTNGDVEEAITAALVAEKEYAEFVQQLAAAAVSK